MTKEQGNQLVSCKAIIRPVVFQMRGKNRKIQKISEISNRHRMFMIVYVYYVRMYMTAFWMHVGVYGQREYYVCLVTVHTHNTLF